MNWMLRAKLFQGEAVKPSSLEIPEAQSKTTLGTCSSWLCLSKVFGFDDLQRKRLTSTSLWETKERLSKQECIDHPKIYYYVIRLKNYSTIFLYRKIQTSCLRNSKETEKHTYFKKSFKIVRTGSSKGLTTQCSLAHASTWHNFTPLENYFCSSTPQQYAQHSPPSACFTCKQNCSM